MQGNRDVVSYRAVGPDLVVVLHPAANWVRASARVENSTSFWDSSQKRPLKLSMNPFYIGFPGAMQCQEVSVLWHPDRIAVDVNFVPMVPGRPRRAMTKVMRP